MRHDYAADPARRDLQLESLAHVNCQRKIEERLQHEPDLKVSSAEFILWCTKFSTTSYLRRVNDEKTGNALNVEGGELRQREVQVGHHIAPLAEALPSFLDRFAGFYPSTMV